MIWIELGLYLQWFREPVRWPQEPEGALMRVFALMALTLAAETIVGLWVTGGLRPLSAL